MSSNTKTITYLSSDPCNREELKVETDPDLSEALFEIGDLPVCLTPQTAAQIVRQLVDWIGDRAARA